MIEYEFSDNLKKILKKLLKKDKPQYGQLMKKIQEVVSSENPEHYKNLRNIFETSFRMGHQLIVYPIRRIDKGMSKAVTVQFRIGWKNCYVGTSDIRNV